ncbi:MAG: mono/diheme cytochrome c family protein [Bacteroidia bacterium]|jgi:mono/diheme cytochrome c family protein
MRSTSILLICFAFVLLSVTSCYYDVEEELYPVNTCDTANVLYSNQVSLILKNECLNCHNSNNAPFIGGGVVLEGYANLKLQVDNGKLVSSITHDGNASFMPESANNTKLPDCDIAQITAWVNAGAPNN